MVDREKNKSGTLEESTLVEKLQIIFKNRIEVFHQNAMIMFFY